jgi:heptaprenyl diphosphate synthase
MALMPSLTEIESAGRAAVTRKATLLLAAVALNAAESVIPRVPFFPWLKPGFANVITILWLARYGFADAMLYTALRTFLSGFYFGFSMFTFSLSLSGGLLSVAAMWAMWATLGKRGLVGAVGIAVVGALFHNAGQLAVVYFMMSGNMGVLGQLPFMLAASAVFGSAVGILAPTAARAFERVNTDACSNSDINATRHEGRVIAGYNPQSPHNPGSAVNHVQPATASDKIAVALTFAASFSLMLADNAYTLIAAVGAFSLISLILNPRQPGVAFYPLRFYALFIFVAFANLIFTPGTRVEFAPFVTVEGVAAFCKQSMRLWCWLQTAHIFKRFNFHLVFISILCKLFPNQRQKETLEAGMIALERFPEAARAARPPNRRFLFELASRPGAALAGYMGAVAERVGRIAKEPL